MQKITNEEEQQARQDYLLFWERHPTQRNPSDINTKEKFDFAMEIGWRRLQVMQHFRKRAAAWTKY